MRQSRIQIARSDIILKFDTSEQRIFTRSDLDRILQTHRQFWRLATRTTTNDFIAYLQKSSKLREIALEFPSRTDIRYVWDEAPTLEVVASLRPRSYISHFTALKCHGLTQQVPKTIYVNSEQQGRSNPESRLDQTRIRLAFSRPQRASGNIAFLGDYRICLLSGQNTGEAGVVTQTVTDIATAAPATVRITNLERTLIDIAVRPSYSGGVDEVLTAYRNALGQASVNRLTSLLKNIGYVYPYHQAIGFYLERAGFKPSAVDLLRAFPIEYDFYLTHEMLEQEYVPQWRLYIPKGF